MNTKTLSVHLRERLLHDFQKVRINYSFRVTYFLTDFHLKMIL